MRDNQADGRRPPITFAATVDVCWANQLRALPVSLPDILLPLQPQLPRIRRRPEAMDRRFRLVPEHRVGIALLLRT